MSDDPKFLIGKGFIAGDDTALRHRFDAAIAIDAIELWNFCVEGLNSVKMTESPTI
jgi:hypothetical protein